MAVETLAVLLLVALFAATLPALLTELVLAAAFAAISSRSLSIASDSELLLPAAADRACVPLSSLAWVLAGAAL